jgi:hypothetical protein
MTEKLPCNSCGELILPSTAQRTGGLCMPCKTGYRKEIEWKKFLREAEMKHLNTPVGQHWQWLSNKVYESPDNFYSFSSANQTFFSVEILKANVCNGGFIQYFSRDAADYFVEAIFGLMEVGATESLRNVMRAKEIYFGADPMPRTEDARKAILSTSEPTEEQSNEIKALDESFFKLSDKLHEQTVKFVEKHRLFLQTTTL